MAQDKLNIFNIALRALGERKLTALTDSIEARFLLDEVYDSGTGVITFLLQQGLWNHAIRAIKIDKSSSVTPAFGLQNAFDLPTDYVRLVSITSDEFFNSPLIQYEREAAFFYANVDPIYIRYVSDDASFGSDLTLWPENFALWAGHHLAVQIGPNLITLKGDALKNLELRVRRLLTLARSTDAQEEPPRFPPLSSWASARLGRGSRRDRGSRSRLIG